MTKRIKANEEPIKKKGIDNLIDLCGFKVDLIMEREPSEDGKDQYTMFIKYKNIIRQVYTNKGDPRVFKDLNRAKEWAKKTGFNHLFIQINLV